MLVLVMGGTAPTWAWEYETSKTDGGGGNYTFRSEKREWAGRYAWNACDFTTQKTLNFSDVQLCWEFDFRVANLAPSFYIENLRFEGEVYVVNGDNSVQQIGTWSKTKSSSSNPEVKDTNFGIYGHLQMEKVDDGHTMKLKYWPTGEAHWSKVKRIILKHRFIYGNDSWDSGWMQYEKDITFSDFVGDGYPLSPLSAEWTEDGKVRFTATDVVDRLGHSEVRSQFYYMALWRSGIEYHHLSIEDATRTQRTDGNYDLSFTTDFIYTYNDCSFTTPVYALYRGDIDVQMPGMSGDEAFCNPKLRSY